MRTEWGDEDETANAIRAGHGGAIGFLWHHFGEYHMDRCAAVARAAGAATPVIGLELASRSDTYAWPETGAGDGFRKVTLFPGGNADHLRTLPRVVRVLRALRRHRIRVLFIAGYEQPANLIVALLAPLIGCRCFVMLDSKFDDKRRRLSMEVLKRVLMLPYRGGLASGPRAADYLRLLGLRRRRVVTGYDTVSIDRMRGLADTTRPWGDRAFVAVARFVPKKNLSLLLSAYAAYRARQTGPLRRLRLCGDGPLAAGLRAQAEALGITADVDFLGFLPQSGIARELADALCLLLPSTEEQWGLVVNEAIAFGLPVLASDKAGATDVLVRNWRNGFILDPHDTEAWAAAMIALSADEALWARFHGESAKLAELWNVDVFARGVARLLAPWVHRRRASSPSPAVRVQSGAR